jgi:glycosyltransferase involved in cell wall biosynthesis
MTSPSSDGYKVRLAILGSGGYPSTYGGFETFVRHFAPYAGNKGHEVAVYFRYDKRRFLWKVTEAEGVFQHLTPGTRSQSSSTLTYGITSSIDALFRQFDVILVVNVPNGFFLPIIRASGAVTVVNVDAIGWERGKWSSLCKRTFRLGTRATAKFGDELIADSDAIWHIWQQQFIRDTQFLPFGAKVLAPRSLERIEKLGLSENGYLLDVARLVPENNIDLIVSGFEASDTNLPLVIVGSGQIDAALEARLRNLESLGRVLRLGHVSDQELLLDLWSHTSLYLHGHSVGGTNPALLQALGDGSPTLALYTPFNREVLLSPEQLFGKEALSITKVINLRIKDRATLDRRADHGHSLISSRYRWDDVYPVHESRGARCKRKACHPRPEDRQLDRISKRVILGMSTC